MNFADVDHYESGVRSVLIREKISSLSSLGGAPAPSFQTYSRSFRVLWSSKWMLVRLFEDGFFADLSLRNFINFSRMKSV